MEIKTSRAKYYKGSYHTDLCTDSGYHFKKILYEFNRTILPNMARGYDTVTEYYLLYKEGAEKLTSRSNISTRHKLRVFSNRLARVDKRAYEIEYEGDIKLFESKVTEDEVLCMLISLDGEGYNEYPATKNILNKELITKIKNSGYENIDYGITEKIRGINTQVKYYIREDQFILGNKYNRISANEIFYNIHTVIPKFYDKIKNIAKILIKEYKTLDYVIIYGELFGGRYYHSDIKKIPKAIEIKPEINYSPRNEWKAFDIAYRLKGDINQKFISQEAFFRICKEVELDTVPLIKISSNLSEALKYPNDQASIVYKTYSLPEIKNNIMEGVIIKPWISDISIDGERVTLCHKNYKFMTNIKTFKKSKEYTNALSFLMEYIKTGIEKVLAMYNQNKIIKQDIVKLMVKDILTKFKKDYDINKLSREEQKCLKKKLQIVIKKKIKNLNI